MLSAFGLAKRKLPSMEIYERKPPPCVKSSDPKSPMKYNLHDKTPSKKNVMNLPSLLRKSHQSPPTRNNENGQKKTRIKRKMDVPVLETVSNATKDPLHVWMTQLQSLMKKIVVSVLRVCHALYIYNIPNKWTCRTTNHKIDMCHDRK